MITHRWLQLRLAHKKLLPTFTLDMLRANPTGGPYWEQIMTPPPHEKLSCHAIILRTYQTYDKNFLIDGMRNFSGVQQQQKLNPNFFCPIKKLLIYREGFHSSLGMAQKHLFFARINDNCVLCNSSQKKILEQMPSRAKFKQ